MVDHLADFSFIFGSVGVGITCILDWPSHFFPSRQISPVALFPLREGLNGVVAFTVIG